MIKKVIYDFEEKMKQIVNISKNNKYQIIDKDNKWQTEYGLPIKHFEVGKGKRHVVFGSISWGRNNFNRIFDIRT